jgi:DNA repair protein RAD16
VYDPGEQSTPAYPGDASDGSALSDLSDAESDFSDSSEPARGSGAKGKGKAGAKGKGKGKAGFAGRGRRLVDGEEVEPDLSASRIGDSTAHIGYCSRREDETDEEYNQRCFKKYTYDQGAENRQEFQKQERKLKKELGRKLTNGEKNHIRLTKVSHLYNSDKENF